MSSTSGMPWFRLYRDIVTSPKLIELELAIGEAALAHLVKWWCAVAAHRPDGDVSSLSVRVQEHLAGWRGEPGALMTALREAGFLDASGTRVSGWDERQGGLVAKTERDREHAASQRAETRTLRPSQRVDATVATSRQRVGEREERREEKRREEEDLKSVGELSRADDPAAETPHTPTMAVAPPPAARAQRPRMGLGVIGLEMRASWPQSPEDVAAWRIPTEALAKLVGGGARVGDTLQEAWSRRFPCFDGHGDRFSLDAAMRAPARHWLEVQELQGKMRWSWPEQAIDEMARWLTKDHETAKRSKAMDERAASQGVHLDGSGGMTPERRALHDRWKRERERGADLPPFAEWVRKVEEADSAARSRTSGTRKLIQDAQALDLTGGDEGLQLLKQRTRPGSGGEHEARR